MPERAITAISVVPPPMSTIHVAGRFFYIETNTDRCCHRLSNQVNFLSTRLLRGVLHSPALHLGDTTGNANHHSVTRRKKTLLIRDHFDHAPDHVFSNGKVSYYAIPHRGLTVL